MFCVCFKQQTILRNASVYKLLILMPAGPVTSASVPGQTYHSCTGFYLRVNFRLATSHCCRPGVYMLSKSLFHLPSTECLLEPMTEAGQNMPSQWGQAASQTCYACCDILAILSMSSDCCHNLVHATELQLYSSSQLTAND